jgi:hypothetical protein
MVQSPQDLLVLQGLRLKGFIQAASLAEFVDLPVDAVDGVLQQSLAAGWTQFRDGSRSGWSLTAEGRKENDRMLADELDSSQRRSDLEARYRDFLDLNRRMLDVCTRWQVKDVENQVLNDHEDEAYDSDIIGRLGEIDSEVQPICAELGRWFHRFSGYGPRFATALENLRAGDRDWFTKPTIDSYHTVWFELHEDLLVTLGIDRASERV